MDIKKLKKYSSVFTGLNYIGFLFNRRRQYRAIGRLNRNKFELEKINHIISNKNAACGKISLKFVRINSDIYVYVSQSNDLKISVVLMKIKLRSSKF